MRTAPLPLRTVNSSWDGSPVKFNGAGGRCTANLNAPLQHPHQRQHPLSFGCALYGILNGNKGKT